MKKGCFFSPDGHVSLAGLEEMPELPAFTREQKGAENRRDSLRASCSEAGVNDAGKKAFFFGNVYFVKSPRP